MPSVPARSVPDVAIVAGGRCDRGSGESASAAVQPRRDRRRRPRRSAYWHRAALRRTRSAGAAGGCASSSTPARRKTDSELAHAREATRIAELGYKHLLDIARPGMSEDELAAELRWHSKSLGAEDNFVLLCAGPHNKAVAPSNGRRMQAGDTIVCEITPSYRGQLAQICRTIVLGEAPTLLRGKYDLVVQFDAGRLRRRRAGRDHGRYLPRHQHRAGGAKATANSATRRISAAAATGSASARSSPATWRSTTISCSNPTCCS